MLKVDLTDSENYIFQRKNSDACSPSLVVVFRDSNHEFKIFTLHIISFGKRKNKENAT